MTTVINYDRLFAVPTAKRGDTVDVAIRIRFISPLAPSTNCWFDNVGDNLGGSKSASGPLNYVSTVQTAGINISPTTIHQAVAGDSGALGCYRMWADNGSSYPSNTSPLTDVWRPTQSNIDTSLIVILRFQVHSNATIGTVITAPTRATPCSNTNIDANKMMIDLGSDMYLNILTGTPVDGFSRTLTIVE